nr:MAG TPA: hypothetical protein [Caudoviricetes sp.]
MELQFQKKIVRHYMIIYLKSMRMGFHNIKKTSIQT